MTLYTGQRNSRRPYTTVYLQLTTNTSQVYIPFLILRHAIQHYLFAANEPMSQVTVMGKFSPKMRMVWPTLTITHNLLNASIDWPPIMELSYRQARILRRALQRDPTSIKPLFYAHRKGDTGPTPISIWNGIIPRDTIPPTPPESAEPTAPADGEQVTEPVHLYPIV